MALASGEGAPSASPADLTRLLWQEAPRARRGPKPKLTVAQIVAAAIAVADEDGLPAVTMQRVAERLGSTKMALYRYVPGKAELTALMLDHCLGLPERPAAGGWRAALTEWTSAIYRRSSSRPWSVELIQRPHPPGPRELAWYESGLAALAGLPLTGAERLDVLALLVGHALGIVRQSQASVSPESDLAATMASILAERANDYPHTAAAFADAATGRDQALGFGVARILDGIDALVASRS